MADFDPNLNTDTPEQEQDKPAYTPASFEKRTAAWMGIVYSLMFLFVLCFSMFRPDRSLAGSFPLFLVPVAVAAIVVAVRRQIKGIAPGGWPTTVFVVLLCLAAAALGLWLGVPVLAVAFGG